MNNNIKKALGIGASVLSVVVLAIFGIWGDKDDFADFLKNATDDELDAEREKVRLDSCNPNLDLNYRISCRNKLSAFDAEKHKRHPGNEEPHAPSRHREHGWYLPNDD
jgi:hypothetical protein